jgi:hypothetical protein
MWLLLTLTGLSAIALIVGIIWILVTHGQTHRRSGPEVGEEVMTTALTDTPLFFKGKAVAIEREASIGLDDIKTAIKTGQWHIILALLLILSGLVGMCLCGGLSLLSVI